MVKRLFLVICITLLLDIVSVGSAEPATIEVPVTSPVYNQTCHINEVCTISWNKSTLTGYGSVFLHVVQVDLQHPTGLEGGGYPVANTGSYQWIIPENVGPLESTAYCIRIKTSDGKYKGQSPIFVIKKKPIMQHIPPKKIKVQ
jgi:hypothetical protein